MLTERHREIMQAAAERTMLDTCQILEPAETPDVLGLPQRTYSVAATSACGLDQTASREVTGETGLTVTDGALRLPLSVAVSNRARIRVTHRYGEALPTPLEYEVLGEPMRGPSAQVLDLRTATTATVEA